MDDRFVFNGSSGWPLRMSHDDQGENHESWDASQWNHEQFFSLIIQGFSLEFHIPNVTLEEMKRIPIPSMGLVHLTTFGAFLWYINVAKCTSPMDPMGSIYFYTNEIRITWWWSFRWHFFTWKSCTWKMDRISNYTVERKFDWKWIGHLVTSQGFIHFQCFFNGSRFHRVSPEKWAKASRKFLHLKDGVLETIHVFSGFQLFNPWSLTASSPLESHGGTGRFDPFLLGSFGNLAGD